MGLKQAVMRVYVEINADLFLECSLKFTLQLIDKFRHPTVMLVVFLAVRDENVIIITIDNA